MGNSSEICNLTVSAISESLISGEVIIFVKMSDSGKEVITCLAEIGWGLESDIASLMA